MYAWIRMVAIVAAGPTAAASFGGEKPVPAKTDLYGDPLPAGATTRMGTTQFRYKQPVIAFADEGKTFIAIDGDGIVWKRSVASWNRIGEHQLALPKSAGGAAPVREVSLDGKLLAVGFADTVTLWDVATGEQRHRLAVKSASSARCVFTPNGRLLVTMERQDNAYAPGRIWDTSTGRHLGSFESKSPVSIWSNVAFSRDGKLFASVDFSRQLLQLWDAATGKILRECPSVNQHLDFAPDGQSIAVGGCNGVTLFDVASLRQVAHLPLPSPEWVTALKFSPDGSTLWGGRQEADLLVWDVASRKLKFRLDGLHNDHLRFSADGKVVAAWDNSSQIVQLWDAALGQRWHHRPGHGGFVVEAVASWDGKTLATTAVDDPVVRLWDAGTGNQVREYRTEDPWAKSVAVSADGKTIAAGGPGGTVHVWELATGKELLRLDARGAGGGGGDVSKLHLSADGKRVSAVSVNFLDGVNPAMLRVWDSTTRQLLIERPLRIEVFTRKTANGEGKVFLPHYHFAPDRDLVTLRSGGNLFLENTRIGRELFQVGDRLGSPLAFSPDGRLIAAAEYKPGGDPFLAEEVQAVVLAETATGRSRRTESTASRSRPTADSCWDATTGRFASGKLRLPRKSFAESWRPNRQGAWWSSSKAAARR